MLGKGSVHADVCHRDGFIGADFDIPQDLTGQLPEKWTEFNAKFIPVYLEIHPGKSRIAAGLACGMLWTIAKGFAEGDVVLCPDGRGSYLVGEVSGPYFCRPGEVLPHRRPVRWREGRLAREAMSPALRNSTGSVGTVSDVTRYRDEIEQLTRGQRPISILPTDPTVEDPVAFAMEKHLEAFLVENWAQTELGAQYDIYEEDGERVGQQYQTDTGPLDVLAVSKDKKVLLVVELKLGQASDSVVGQIQRYMGYVAEELAEDWQTVRGVIIALDDDKRIRRALSVAPNIDFYRYQVSFKLIKGGA